MQKERIFESLTSGDLSIGGNATSFDLGAGTNFTTDSINNPLEEIDFDNFREWLVYNKKNGMPDTVQSEETFRDRLRFDRDKRIDDYMQFVLSKHTSNPDLQSSLIKAVMRYQNEIENANPEDLANSLASNLRMFEPKTPYDRFFAGQSQSFSGEKLEIGKEKYTYDTAFSFK